MNVEKFNIFSYLLPKNQTFYLNEKTTIRQAIEKFDYHKFSVVPIINDEGNYVSTISEGDILRYIKNCHNFSLSNAENTYLKDIEHYRSYKSLNINATFDDVVKLALDQNFIPVLDDRNKFIGILKRRSILENLVKIAGDLPK